ncbi:hypothetical protein QAD02_006690 [Eretmocerus hayati]|uniref:Uncharacterized protein n=1 Tax=Eretmocerus hayati TaxID=131215 RepID=A0ACC2N2Q4_9HYME|nr:hypothetical protein QAD02_006690 [Eretmocerus hayati]
MSSYCYSSENPTTMMPTLTTPRQQQQLFEYLPVNKISDDSKGGLFSPTKNFEDVGDVNLVPAGSNSRIQVKKGPNGKDYEYEYVYYYYDEDEDGKQQQQQTGSKLSSAPSAGTSSSSSSSGTPSRRGSTGSNSASGTPQRAKYNAAPAEAQPSAAVVSTEPTLGNEIVPAGSRARQVESSSGADLSSSTRFPPRGRQNQVAETPERVSRARGNRQRQQPDAIDSNSFRNPQEGPEFPRSFPDGPYRFIGVTPNEGVDEKSVNQPRGRPSRIQDPAPVRESNEDLAFQRQPASVQYGALYEGNPTQNRQQQTYHTRADDFGASIPAAPARTGSFISRSSADEAYTESATGATDAPTTQYPRAMEKVARDLYAFVQQGRSNLVDFVNQAEDQSSEVTDSSSDSSTELPAAAIPSSSADNDDSLVTAVYPTTTPDFSFSPSSLGTARPTYLPSPSTTTTTTTTTPAPTNAPSEEPSSAQTSFGRAKFRRPGPAASSGVSTTPKSRFRPSSSSSSSSTESSVIEASSTQKARGRFGSTSSGSKRSRPSGTNGAGSKPAEETLHKENADKVNSESKSTTPARGRYRGGSARPSPPQARTTAAPEKTPSNTATSTPRTASFNKLPSSRRRPARPGALTTASVDEAAGAAEQTATGTGTSPSQDGTTSEPHKPFGKSPVQAVSRPNKPLGKPLIRPGVAKPNNRLKIGQQTSTTEATPSDSGSASVTHGEEPDVEGTEEESREAPAETSPATKATPAGNALNNKLRQRTTLKVHPKTTTPRVPVPPASRRSHLLPKRTTTEAPPSTAAESSSSSADESASDDSEQDPSAQLDHEGAHGSSATTTSEAPHSEPSAAPENPRSLSSLLARRSKPLVPRKPGQPFHSSNPSGAAAGEH